jgi:hypothetical protein
VGTGNCDLGIEADANIFFGVYELNLYDPIVPKAYFYEWDRETHTTAGPAGFNLFCPDIATVAEARQLGISYILEPSGVAGPSGSTLVATLHVPNPHPRDRAATPPGDEDVYFVPYAGAVTLTTGSGGTHVVATSTYSGSSDSNPAQIDEWTHARSAGVLDVRVTSVPGWHATIDGRPLALQSSSIFGLRAQIPAGTHHIQLRYWPSLFTVGLAAALVAGIALGVALLLDWRRKRPRRLNNARHPPASDDIEQFAG